MSRSVHTTRTHLARTMRDQYASNDCKREALEGLEGEIERKRSFKRSDRLARVHHPEMPPTAVESIPIEICDQGEYIQYPATPEDVVELLKRLPRGTVDGLSRIQFRLGFEEQKQESRQDEEGGLDHVVPDPYLGRASLEMAPGVFQPPLWGTYVAPEQRIELFAFVYRREALQGPWEILAKLHMLTTLVHEVAHHDDVSRGITRDSWNVDHLEAYAQEAEYGAADLVARYVRERYPAETSLLETWLETHVGVAIPLEFLASDSYGQGKKGYYEFWDALFGKTDQLSIAQAAVQGLEMNVPRENVADLMLMYGPERLIGPILANMRQNGADPTVMLVLQARLHHRRREFETARDLATQYTETRPESHEGWLALYHALRALGDWRGCARALGGGLDSFEHPFYTPCFHFRRAQAFLELNEVEDMERDLVVLESTSADWKKNARVIRGEYARRHGAVPNV